MMHHQKKMNGILTHLPLYDEDNCVVFISLMKDIGIVKKISKNCERVIKFNAQDIVGKNITLIIPEEIGVHH